jgi:glycosyltransferase involved in cell wall biosynthesis
MADGSETPLVTFFVMAYNQSRFVREAVEGALAQTYSPLEIVLSDDCSTDDTFDIIQEIAKGYSGPHIVILNRNERNLGLSEHLNRIVALATGELIVAADGDDVSSPQRTQRCVEVWLENSKPAALASSVACIDAVGKASKTRNGLQWFSQFFPPAHQARTDSLLRFSKEGSPRLVSCSAAWTKKVCDAFGPLPTGIWFEDDIMTLRAWLFDRIVFIPEALVRYREHDSNLFNRVHPSLATRNARRHAEQATRTEARRRREALLSYGPDLELAVRQQWITRPLFEELKRDVTTRCAFHQVIEDWWNVGWILRLGLLLFLIRSGRLNEGRWCSARLLPFPMFLALGAIWSKTAPWTRLLSFAQRTKPAEYRRWTWLQRVRQALTPRWKAGRADAASPPSGSSWQA